MTRRKPPARDEMAWSLPGEPPAPSEWPADTTPDEIAADLGRQRDEIAAERAELEAGWAALAQAVAAQAAAQAATDDDQTATQPALDDPAQDGATNG